mgnify:FL=1
MHIINLEYQYGGTGFKVYYWMPGPVLFRSVGLTLKRARALNLAKFETDIIGSLVLRHRHARG